MHLNAFRYAMIVAFGGFIFGLDAALISGTVGFVTTEFNLSDIQIGTVVSAPGFGVIIALFTIPPNPRWLLLKGKEEAARKVLSKLVPDEEIEEQLWQMQRSLSEQNAQLSIKEQLSRLLD